MAKPTEPQNKLLYDRITSHHEHSDENYIKYFNSLIAVNTAIFAGISLLYLDFVENFSIFNIFFIIFLCVFGIYICYVYNRYLQNEKTYQDYLIKYFGDYKLSIVSPSSLEPAPFGNHKRKISDPKRSDVDRERYDGGWSQFPKIGKIIYIAIMVICALVIVTTYSKTIESVLRCPKSNPTTTS